MNVAVVGGAGFIGSRLVKRLVEDDQQVTVFDNFSRGKPTNLPDGITLVTADAKDGGMNLRGFDWVYDFAARVAGARDLYKDPAILLSDNLRITSSVLQAVVDGQVPNYFYVSSSCVYDFPGAKVPHVEEDTNICDTSYGFSKVIGEQLTKWYARQYGFNVRIARLFNVYGPGDSFLSPHVIPEFLRKAEEARTTGEFAILGDGTQTRDFTWMGDVIEGLLTITDRGTHLQPYNIGTGKQHSIRQLAELVCEVAGLSGIRFTMESTPPPKEDIQKRAADNTKLRGLGWEPLTDLRTGITAMLMEKLAV